MTDDTFTIERIDDDPRVTVLRIHGRLHARHAGRMLEQCTQVRESGRDLVLNLAQISFIASTGVGALLAAGEEFQQAGRTLCIVQPSPPVDAVLKLLNLDQFLRIAPTERAALDAREAA